MKTLKQIDALLRKNIKNGKLTSAEAITFMKAVIVIYSAEIISDGFKGKPENIFFKY